VPYKRIDLAVQAFNALGLPLKVIGVGPEERRLRALARPNVEFLGWVAQEDLPEYYARSRALIFPGEEDFGIVPVEAQAAGKPVVAYGRGGVMETVIPINRPKGPLTLGVRPEEGHPTGVFFYEKSVGALKEAVQTLERVEGRFDLHRMRANAARFDISVFREKMGKAIQRRLEGWWQ
jgi:glycosyltransferase involved in cell wall biosynthesis